MASADGVEERDGQANEREQRDDGADDDEVCGDQANRNNTARTDELDEQPRDREDAGARTTTGAADATSVDREEHPPRVDDGCAMSRVMRATDAPVKTMSWINSAQPCLNLNAGRAAMTTSVE